MATLIDRRETEPGIFFERWEEDGFMYPRYVDTRRQQRMDERARARSLNPRIHSKQEALYAVGNLADHERVELMRRFPALGDPDPHISQKAWKRFWQSSLSEPYRIVGKV